MTSILKLLKQIFVLRNGRVVFLFGQLGNQIFQLSFAACVKKKTCKPVFVYGDLDENLQDLALRLGLTVVEGDPSFFYKGISRALFRWAIKYDRPDVLIGENDYRSLVFCGYWQSKKYICNDFETEFLLWRRQKLESVSPKPDEDLFDGKSLVVQVRLGDFKDSMHDVLTEDYFSAALTSFYNLGVKQVFLASNDIVSAREFVSNTLLKNKLSMDLHLLNGKTYFEEFLIMSRFSNIIISNSSFGWWAAFTSESVVAPSRWYVATDVNTDFFPVNWNLLNV